MRSSLRMWAALGVFVLGLGTSAFGQGLTGQMSGSVVDSSNSVLPGATVVVTNTGTQASRTVTTDASGVFTVTELLAGHYEVSVTLEGFKSYLQRDVVLSANERVALRAIVLEVGTMGHCDWGKIIGTLKEIGYDGALTVEFVAPVDRTPANPYPNAIEKGPVNLTADELKFIEDHGSGTLSNEFYTWLVEETIKTLRRNM